MPEQREVPEPLINDRGQWVCPYSGHVLAPSAYEEHARHCAELAERAKGDQPERR